MKKFLLALILLPSIAHAQADVLVILVNFPDYQQTPHNTTTVQNYFNFAVPQIRSWSYGNTNLTHQTFGYYQSASPIGSTRCPTASDTTPAVNGVMSIIGITNYINAIKLFVFAMPRPCNAVSIFTSKLIYTTSIHAFSHEYCHVIGASGHSGGEVCQNGKCIVTTPGERFDILGGGGGHPNIHWKRLMSMLNRPAYPSTINVTTNGDYLFETLESQSLGNKGLIVNTDVGPLYVESRLGSGIQLRTLDSRGTVLRDLDQGIITDYVLDIGQSYRYGNVLVTGLSFTSVRISYDNLPPNPCVATPRTLNVTRWPDTLQPTSGWDYNTSPLSSTLISANFTLTNATVTDSRGCQGNAVR